MQSSKENILPSNVQQWSLCNHTCNQFVGKCKIGIVEGNNFGCFSIFGCSVPSNCFQNRRSSKCVHAWRDWYSTAFCFFNRRTLIICVCIVYRQIGLCITKKNGLFLDILHRTRLWKSPGYSGLDEVFWPGLYLNLSNPS